MNVLVVNAGSSSLKLALLDGAGQVLASTALTRWAGDDAEPLADFVEEVPPIDAVGHRIVHGGEHYRGAVLVDEDVRTNIAALTELAPLHQPRSLGALDVAFQALPDIPHVACFDTTFHATLPDAAATYPLPERWRQRWGLRRCGFHGLSHAYVARRAGALLGHADGSLRVVSAHLGAGASLCAINGGRSVDTTMGFTPLEGLVMATRSGSVDPGLLLWLLRRQHLTIDELADGLEHESGLAGLAAGSGDLRDVRAAAETGDERARLAMDVYLHRLRGGIAAMAAAMNGIDVLVFTGGVGEHDVALRSHTAACLRFLGVSVDESRNATCQADSVISAPDSSCAVLVVESREDLEIADQTRGVLSRVV